ncbi:MAG TPA: hypothetical protein VIL28_02930 [Steroidobacteraceae bacterium]
MSDSAVKAKTGKVWKSWFAALDRADAQKLAHKEIAKLLATRHGVSGWWSQMITVEYERARGLREVHQTANGFAVSATKTIAANVSDVFQAAASPAMRKQWFPSGAFKVSSQTPNKYLNGSWNGTTRLNIGCYRKGPNKSQIAVQVMRLPNKRAVESQRAAWKAALQKLQTLLET